MMKFEIYLYMVMNNPTKNEEIKFDFSHGFAFIYHDCVLHFS